ncbi:MAG: ABC-F family ATP-binding cassette domain-containing protein [Opitutales bacterium]
MITLSGLNLAFGGRPIFADVTATLNRGDRIGLVGPNGAGKTTLFRVLLGRQPLDGGKVETRGQTHYGYLPQDGLETRGRTLLDEAFQAFPDILRLQHDLAEANERLHNLDTESREYRDLLDRIGAWEHDLEERQPERLQSRCRQVLGGLGFRETDFNRDTGGFSGGWQMRIALARILLSEPDCLLLDEPTNHLDLPALRWLERFLQQYEGTLVLISHDRTFLNTVTTRTFHLARGRLESFDGPFDAFTAWLEEQQAIRQRAAANQARYIEKQQQFIDRFRSKATKATQVQSRIKALERIERIESEDGAPPEIHFRFPPPPRSSPRVVELEGVTKTYGDQPVFRNLDCRIADGDRVAIVGPNGAGKSTLARILVGVEPFQTGRRSVGHNTRFGWFAQHQAEELDERETVLSSLESVLNRDHPVDARTLLGAFLFPGDDAFKPVKVLSGGERNRLALARMLVRRANCLVFDEPTNHLDMTSKSVLQDAIQHFKGTVLIVSHDRDFLEPLADKVLEITFEGARWFPGNVSEYLADLEARETGPSSPGRARTDSARGDSQGSSSLSARDRRRLEADKRARLAPLRKRLESLETENERLRTRIQDLETAMMDPVFFSRGEATSRDMQEHELLKRKLERGEQAWLETAEAIDAAEA